MKKIYFLAAALLMFSVTASAQFMNSSKSAASSTAEDVFNTLELTYSPLTMKSSFDGRSLTEDLNALSLAWMQARLLPVNNLYLQYGAGLQWAFKNDTDGDEVKVKTSTNFVTVKVPVNILYNVNIPSTSIGIMPYAGLNLQGHLIGSSKSSVTYEGETESETTSFFSSDDMGEDDTYSRFVVGWQIGAKVSFNNFLVGIAYEGPVTNLYKEDNYKINYSLVNITLGFKF